MALLATSHALAMAAALPVSPSPSSSFRLLSSSSRSQAFAAAAVRCRSPATLPMIVCGRGDKKTAKGKRFKHSYGNSRPRDQANGRGYAPLFAPPRPRKPEEVLEKVEFDFSFENPGKRRKDIMGDEDEFFEEEEVDE